MGLNVFLLFTGFGFGSLVFGGLLRLGFGPALAAFGIVKVVAALAAMSLFQSEVPPEGARKTA